MDDLLQALRDKRSDPAARTDTQRARPLYPPTTDAVVVAAEREMGLALPPLLRRVYVEVGNGGFGPGFGLLGLAGGHADVDGRHLPEKYLLLRSQGWPASLLPLWDWGCGSWSCADAATTEGTIVTMDEYGRTRTAFSLASWLHEWARGTNLYEEIYEMGSAIILNPFTRKPMAIKHVVSRKGTPE